MTKKLTAKQETEICKKYKNGASAQGLADEYGVHLSTISRLISRNGLSKNSVIRVSQLPDDVRLELKKLLMGLGIPNPNSVVMEIEKHFQMKLRKQQEYIIYDVKEWED